MHRHLDTNKEYKEIEELEVLPRILGKKKRDETNEQTNADF